MSHRRGSSNTVLTIVLGLAAVAILACCGGGYFAFRKVGEVATEFGKKFIQVQEEMNVTDPAKIDAVRAEIATIEIPAVFKPQKASTNPFTNAHRVIYRAEGRQRTTFGFLTLADANADKMFEEGDFSAELKLEHAGPVAGVTTPHRKNDPAKPHSPGVNGTADGKHAPPKGVEEPGDADAAADEEDDEPKARAPGDKPAVTEKNAKELESKKAAPAANVKFEIREPIINGHKARFQMAEILGPDQKVETIEVFGEFRTKGLRYAQFKMRVTPDLINSDQAWKMVDSIL